MTLDVELDRSRAQHCVRPLDIQRTLHYERFFSVWGFDTRSQLFEAIASLEIDAQALARAHDVRMRGLGGWLYWTIFIKGYFQYVESGSLALGNVYHDFMGSVFEVSVHDPGLASEIADPAARLIRVERRFRDFALFHDVLATDPGRVLEIQPVTAHVARTPSADTDLFFELDSPKPLHVRQFDGYHRLFLARLFELEWLPCVVTYVDDDDGARAQGDALREIARFYLPYNGTVAVASGGRRELLDLFPRRVVDFSAPQPDRSASAVLAANVEAARADGAEFLVLPDSERWQADFSPFLAYLGRHYRELFRDRSFYIYALDRLDREPSWRWKADDGLRLPPPDMLRLAIGTPKPDFFIRGGLQATTSIRLLLARNGAQLDELGAILDFGCGCGRVLRHLRRVQGQVHGVDYNPYLLEWCRRELPFATYERSALAPGLDSEGERFDLAIAMAVFTHLDEPHQMAWMHELRRLLKPGAFLIASFHGSDRASELPLERGAQFSAREQFAERGSVVLRPSLAGTNACAAYHQEHYIRETLGSGFELLEYEDGGAVDLRQDLALFRRPTH